ncbi:hypothetical protein LCGC14_0603130 [marine sediment metagenome]|uniref:Uncharacterized protein n=1 Tax=marine sediment metagenome TaxID=412755 RepID=A0A0F9UIF3_9ZZZZ
MPNRSFLRSVFRRYFTGHMEQYSREFRKDGFLINMGLNYCRSMFLEEFILYGNKEEDFNEFFRNVFKDKIKLVRC